LAERLGLTTKGVTFDPEHAVEYLKGKNGTVRGGVADGRPRLDRDVHACEAILALSGTTNGQLAVAGFRALERRTGTRLADPAATGHAGHVRRAGGGRGRPVRGHRALPDAALEMVDPLGVPGQPVHALAVPRRPHDLDVAAGRGAGRDRRQRLDRGGEPQRRG